MKQQLEKQLSVKVPSEYIQYFENTFLNKDSEEVIISVKHLTNNWRYANYKFWMLKELDNNLTNVYSKENTNKLSITKTSQIISRELKIKVLCIAWSHDSVERDTGLFYIDNKIYGYSLNFSNDYKYDLIADNLEVLLDVNEKFNKTIDDIIESKNWFLFDQECLTDGQEYESILKKCFEDTSNNQIHLSNITILKSDEEIHIELTINKKVTSWQLDFHNGWIDPKIIRLMNRHIRKNENINERFVVLKNWKWGQEMGIGFCNPNQVHELEKNDLLK